MLTREEDIDAHALFKQGWKIAAISRHLGRDPKTIRAYLRGDRVAGVRARPAGGDWFDAYVGQRLVDDPHLWATTLFDELVERGFDRSYQTLTRLIRDRGLRPPCEACRPAKDRPVAVIEHRRARRPSGTGSRSPTRPPRGDGPRPTCWSARCRTRVAGGGGSPSRWIRLISSMASTGSAASSA